jgi:hypothetical protein
MHLLLALLKCETNILFAKMSIFPGFNL